MFNSNSWTSNNYNKYNSDIPNGNVLSITIDPEEMKRMKSAYEKANTIQKYPKDAVWETIPFLCDFQKNEMPKLRQISFLRKKNSAVISYF